MPVFAYAGTARGGKSVTAEINADTRELAIEQLRSQGITVKSIEEKKKAKALFGERKQRISDKDIVVFTRQFATMINAGLPLVQCLEILATQCDNKTFGKLIGEVKMDVESGTTYADALKKHPKVFSSLYSNMVQAGEVGGALDVTMQRLANQLEKAAKLKAQVKAAMVYPTAIVGVAIIVVSVLMVWVIPIFSKMFTDFGGTLPAPTLFVIAVSDFMQQYIVVMIIAAVAGLYGLKKYYATPGGKLQIDKLMLKLPVVGDLIRKSAVFPPMVVQMINVGEATGALDAMLGKIADFYDDEVDAAVAALTSLLEPMLMVFLGTVIGFIVIAMYLPIFKMAAVVG